MNGQLVLRPSFIRCDDCDGKMLERWFFCHCSAGRNNTVVWTEIMLGCISCPIRSLILASFERSLSSASPIDRYGVGQPWMQSLTDHLYFVKASQPVSCRPTRAFLYPLVNSNFCPCHDYRIDLWSFGERPRTKLFIKTGWNLCGILITPCFSNSATVTESHRRNRRE